MEDMAALGLENMAEIAALGLENTSVLVDLLMRHVNFFFN